MNTRKSVLAFLVAPFLFSMQALAQEDMPGQPNQSERIVISSLNGPLKNMTIVVDGDNITINGKPAKDNKDVDVFIQKNGTFLKGRPIPGLQLFNDDQMDDNGMNWLGDKNGRAFLGVMTEGNKEGARIKDVTDNSGADSAGLKEGDIITKVNDIKISSPADLSAAIGKFKPQDKVTITYLRDGKSQSTTATLHGTSYKIFSWKNMDGIQGFRMPELKDLETQIQGFNMYRSNIRLGAQVQDMENNTGVKILDVVKDGVIAKAGLQKDDVITKMGDSDITSVDDLRNSLKTLKEGDSITLTYTRNGQQKKVDLKFPKKLKTMNL